MGHILVRAPGLQFRNMLEVEFFDTVEHDVNPNACTVQKAHKLLDNGAEDHGGQEQRSKEVSISTTLGGSKILTLSLSFKCTAFALPACCLLMLFFAVFPLDLPGC